MLFSRIVYASLLVGLIAAVVMSIAQQFQVAPIIFAAESFEGAEVVIPNQAPEAAGGHSHGDHGHDHDHGHHHDAEAWAPEDGAERMFYSLMSNLFAGIGFALIMMAVMSQLSLKGVAKLSPGKGLIWGAAGFAAVFAAPAIGLPPEIPGIEAPPIGNRQIWWLFAVFATACGIAVLAFANIKYKIAGLVMIALPQLIGAPHIAGPEFSHPDPAVVEALTQLHKEFIVASSVSNLLFWLVIGAASAFAVQRWIVHDAAQQA